MEILISDLLSAYYFSQDGEFNFDLLKNIAQFPNVEFFDRAFDGVDNASEHWLKAQKKKRKQKSFILKTHSCLGNYKEDHLLLKIFHWEEFM